MWVVKDPAESVRGAHTIYTAHGSEINFRGHNYPLTMKAPKVHASVHLCRHAQLAHTPLAMHDIAVASTTVHVKLVVRTILHCV